MLFVSSLIVCWPCRQRLLVIGGGGAVGLAAIQLAVDKGCIVSTTCGSESISRLQAAGVEQAVDYKAEVVKLVLLSCYDQMLQYLEVVMFFHDTRDKWLGSCTLLSSSNSLTWLRLDNLLSVLFLGVKYVLGLLIVVYYKVLKWFVTHCITLVIQPGFVSSTGRSIFRLLFVLDN